MAEVDCRPLLGERFAGDLMVWAWLGGRGRAVSRAWVGVARPKHLSLAGPNLRLDRGADERGLYFDVSCDRPAVWVRLGAEGEAGDAVFDDNFFHLHPAEPRRVRLARLARGGPGSVGAVSATSLADHMPARPAGVPIRPRPPGYVSPV